ncbi:MAG TPA: thiol peroxidase [Acidiferrobacterales bacterium]|nr:thiol peroxidase [Acidiferrobacterales bacterium]
MANVLFKGTPAHTSGELPKVGSKAPDFKLTAGDLSEVSLANFKGKKKLLSIVHSLDTGVCANSTKRFNEFAKNRADVVVLVVSCDLPFAQGRFCTAEGVKNVVTLSMMRDRHFAKDYGVLLTDSPLAGLTARATLVLDENDKVLYTQLGPELTVEPDYDQALAALK